MIEIEKKFQLSPEQEKRLLDGATFLSQIKIFDVYFDTRDHRLTKQDIWLRTRNGDFELKVGLKDHDMRVINQYEEITDQNEIRKRLEIPTEASLDEDLLKQGYAPFVSCHTTRKTYEKDGFRIDLDQVEYESDLEYSIAEIELQVDDERERPQAIEKIVTFAKKHLLTDELVRGKVVEYLLQKRYEHYRELVEVGVVKE